MELCVKFYLGRCFVVETDSYSGHHPVSQKWHHLSTQPIPTAQKWYRCTKHGIKTGRLGGLAKWNTNSFVGLAPYFKFDSQNITKLVFHNDQSYIYYYHNYLVLFCFIRKNIIQTILPCIPNSSKTEKSIILILVQ